MRAISRGLSLPLGTALYHLARLERGGEVVARADGRYKRFFLANALGAVEKAYVSALHRSVPRAIATLLLEAPARTQRELSSAIGVSRSTLSFHVQALVGRGILDFERGLPERRYRLAEPGLVARALQLLPPRGAA